ncbi:uncharacterized protein LOC129253876 [Lytechinus pictus]|uniref:uncharacterized protein LOC129253876 n=1 Tax=Lytechinus pictus TaxID=7653 RepID=UPI00240D6BD6|nr:uncharacterized protein LOC129253876 [Lytechinus pictus]
MISSEIEGIHVIEECIYFHQTFGSTCCNTPIMAGLDIPQIIKTLVNESGQFNLHGRTIVYKAEGRVHKFKWVYDGTAWDVASGISVKDRHYSSRHGAIEHAVAKLLPELQAKGLLPT